MALGRRQLGVSQFALFRDQFSRRIGIAGHEDAEGDLKAFEHALVEGRQLGSAGR
jgi:hypothetical protein